MTTAKNLRKQKPAGLCDSDCWGRCKVCPSDWADDVLAALEAAEAEIALMEKQRLVDVEEHRKLHEALCVVAEPVAVVKNCHLGKIDWLDAALNEHGELKLKDDELLYRVQKKAK